MLGGADNPNGELLSYIIGADTQNLTIGSRLYGESSKIQPGVLSGSATLLMILP